MAFPDWVTLRSGRMPRTCEPERCEVVRIRGQGGIPNAPGLRLVEVGTAAVKSPVLFGDFIAPAENEQSRAALSPNLREAARYHRPEQPALILAEGVDGLLGSPELETVYRSYSWVVPLEQGTVPRLGDRPARDRRGPRKVVAADRLGAFDLTAPVEELRAAADASEVAGRRLLLVGGESAALLFAFAVLVAVSMRRDSEAARRRLTWFGARRWQLSVFTGLEAVVVAAGGTAVGWALGSAAGAVVASRAGAPIDEVLAHSTLSESGLIAAIAVAAALALVLLAALRAKPLALAGRSFSALDAAALGALAVIVAHARCAATSTRRRSRRSRAHRSLSSSCRASSRSSPPSRAHGSCDPRSCSWSGPHVGARSPCAWRPSRWHGIPATPPSPPPSCSSASASPSSR